MGAEALPVDTFAAAGAQFAGAATSAFGAYQGQQFAAAQADMAARIGRLRAKQADAHYREELETTLANINAIRASADASVRAPTAMAIRENEARVSDRQRTQAVLNERWQAAQSAADADWRRQAGIYALSGGLLSGLSSSLSTLYKGA